MAGVGLEAKFASMRQTGLRPFATSLFAAALLLLILGLIRVPGGLSGIRFPRSAPRDLFVVRNLDCAPANEFTHDGVARNDVVAGDLFFAETFD